MSSVSPISSGNTTGETAGTSNKQSTLGYQDFLKLLTVQFQNQDPFDPMSDTEYIAQMANFSTLEEVSNFSDNFTTYSARQQQISSQAYLGKYATVEPSGSTAVNGQVTAVSLGNDGSVFVTIDGKQYDASDVTSVSNAAAK
jgi:flagellar basal-body rod modification protein FlgD